jgi:hypothetical protein
MRADADAAAAEPGLDAGDAREPRMTARVDEIGRIGHHDDGHDPVLLNAVCKHFSVTRLEDMQRQLGARARAAARGGFSGRPLPAHAARGDGHDLRARLD